MKRHRQISALRCFLSSIGLGLIVGAVVLVAVAATIYRTSLHLDGTASLIAVMAALLAAATVTILKLEVEITRRQIPGAVELFHNMTRDLPVMVYQFRQFPTGHGSVTQTSEAIRHIYELTPEEARANGAQIFDLVHPDDRDRIWKALVKSYQDLTPWHEEYRVVLPKGGTVWRSAYARLERMPDGGTLWHGFIVDITRQMEAAEALAAEKQRAENADRAKSEFLAMMSHDIRTPLSSVIGFSELLNATDLDATQRDYLNAVRTSGENLLMLVNEILDLSRVEAGKLVLDLSEFDLDSFLRDFLRGPSLTAKKKGIDLTWAIAAGSPRLIMADRARLSQVLVNIVENAIKFTDKGSVYLNVLSHQAADGRSIEWEFVVEDTGIGIPQAKIDRLFEPFAQARASDSQRQHGVGLGLAIARRICNKMGGDIQVSSQLGVGTQMRITIVSPEASGVERETGLRPVEDSESKRAIDFSGLRVLVVEDNTLNARLAKLTLEKLGCVCQTIDDGPAAIELCMESSFNLVLMDLELPSMSGLEATREIRKREAERREDGLKRRHLPIVAFTANAQPEQHEECLKAGMDGFLTKPIRKQALIETLQSVDERILQATSAA